MNKEISIRPDEFRLPGMDFDMRKQDSEKPFTRNQISTALEKLQSSLKFEKEQQELEQNKQKEEQNLNVNSNLIKRISLPRNPFDWEEVKEELQPIVRKK